MTSYHDAQFEIQESVKALSKVDVDMGKLSSTLAYPAGTHNHLLVRSMEELGNRVLDDLGVPTSMRK